MGCGSNIYIYIYPLLLLVVGHSCAVVIIEEENGDDETKDGPYVTDRSKKRKFDQQYDLLPELIKTAYAAVGLLANALPS